MSSGKTCMAGLLVGVLAVTPTARAQIPGAAAGGAAPPVAAGPAAAVPGLPAAAAPAAAPAAAAAPKSIWSALGLSSGNIHACIAKLCNSQFGQMLNSFATG